MAHVAVVGKPSRQRFQATNTLQMQMGTQVSIYTSLQEALPVVKSQSIQLVVLLEDEVTDEILMKIDEFSSQYSDSKLICISKDLNSTAREQFRALRLSNCMILDYIYELQDLQPIAKKMLLGEKVYVRKHYRHRTAQMGQIVTSKSRQNSVVKILDMSHSGLRATYRRLNIKIGEAVHLLVAAADGTQNHRIVAKVAWVNESSREFGVAFEKVSLETATLRFSLAG